ncbi:MAG: ABC transporter permease [Faecousia sp.]
MSGILSFLSSFPTLLHSAIIFGTVIMFGSLGEILTEKSGHLNLGVPGIMYLGGIAGLAGTFMYENVYCANAGITPNAALCVIICLVCTFLAAALGGLIYAFLTISLRTNQNVTGLTLTIFGSGVGNFFGGSLNKLAGGVGQVNVKVTSETFRAYSFGLVNKLDALTGKVQLGTLLFSYGFLTYVAIVFAILLWYFLTKTRTGLCLRAVGENTATADAAGINVTKYKYLATCVGAGISGLGGTYYVMNYIRGTWENQGTIEALGWLAVALVIFATWKPIRSIWGAYLFGVLYWAYNYIPGLQRSSIELFKMLPYVVTLLILIIVSLRRKPEDQPPASLGLAYFREER